MKPVAKENGVWRELEWEEALERAADKLSRIAKQHGGAQIGALASPMATLEEHYLLGRLTRGLGSANLDHRLRRMDFRDETSEPLYPALGCAIVDIEKANGVLVIGANLREDVPLIAHRIRKAAVRGAKVSFINPVRYEYFFPIADYLVGEQGQMFEHLLDVTAAAVNLSGRSAPESIAALVAHTKPTDAHADMARLLGEGDQRLILLGAIAQRHPAFADLRLAAGALAELTGATLGYLPDGGNTVGAHLAGVLPHRAVGGRAVQSPGLNLADMLAARLKSYIVFGAVEPASDISSPAALDALREAEFVLAMSPFASAKEFADLVLPIGTFAETSGTYVNLEGRWQSAPGAARPVGESRPGWKVLRVLGNLLNLQGFDYDDSMQIADAVRKQVAEAPEFAVKSSARTLQAKLALNAAPVETDVPIYQIDPVVRRAKALQNTPAGLARSAGQRA